MNIHSIALAEATAIAPAQHVLHRDYETRGVLQLQKVGPWKYAADDRTEVLCCAFSLDNEPVKLWLPGDPVPGEFLEAAHDPARLACAHNAQFELAIEHLIMRRRHGWPKIPLRPQRCTMAAAADAGRRPAASPLLQWQGDLAVEPGRRGCAHRFIEN